MLDTISALTSPVGLLALALFAAVVWGFWAIDVHTVPASRQIYFCEVRQKHYVREERSGFNNIAQDWWREVQRQPDGSFKMTGTWFKHNVGYFPRSHQDSWPFVPIQRSLQLQ